MHAQACLVVTIHDDPLVRLEKKAPSDKTMLSVC